MQELHHMLKEYFIQLRKCHFPIDLSSAHAIKQVGNGPTDQRCLGQLNMIHSPVNICSNKGNRSLLW